MQSTDSADQQRLSHKRLLEASLFGDEEESPSAKKTKPKEAEDSAHVKERAKVEKNHDSTDPKASKLSTEVGGNSRRSLSKTPEPTSSKHLDDGSKSLRDRHSKHSADSDRHHRQHSHSKHHKSSHHSSSSTSTKQTTPPLSDGKSTATASSTTQQTAKDDTPSVHDSSDNRRVSPLKLTKSSLSAAASSSAQKHSSAHCDMKNLFGDDDDDDDDDDDGISNAAAAAATVTVVKDDTKHKDDHHKPADISKKHTSHSHKKTPDKPSSSKPRPTPAPPAPAAAAAKGMKDKTDIQLPKADHRSSSHSSNKHRQSEPGIEKKSGDAAKLSGKPVTTATRPDSAAGTVTNSKTKTSSVDFTAKSSTVVDAGGSKRKREEESGGCEADLSLSESDENESSESDDVDVCDAQPDKPHDKPHDTQQPQSAAAPPDLASLSREAKAANGEYISVLLDLQKRLMSVADDDILEKLTTMIEETGKYSITDETFDFDLCRLDIQTVNKLKQFLADAY